MNKQFVILGVDRRGWEYELGRTATAHAALQMREAARSTWYGAIVRNPIDPISLSDLEAQAFEEIPRR